MTQEIKINVNANSGSAETAVKKIDDASADAAKSVDKLGGAIDKLGQTTGGAAILDHFAATEAAANKATAAVKRLKAEKDKLSNETIQSTRSTLSGILGQPVSESDARTAAENFRRARKVSSSVRAFDSLEQWNLGVDRVFKDPARAAEHRRRVLGSVLQHTDYINSAGGGGGYGGGGGDDGGRPPPSDFNRGVRKTQSMAMGFGKSMLAMAGITSIAGMAGAGVDMATEESTGIDTLKRRMGDLGVDFDKLRDQARSAGAGLGITYVESTRLAQAYAREAGNISAGDMANGGYGHSVRTGMGMGRSFGFDPSAGVQFFGTMRRLGVAGDEQSNRKLALTIADAIEKGGYGGKADEVLAAIADYSTQVSRITLAAPNVSAFAGAMGSMMGQYPGLDPAGAANILGAADSATRRGGAYGQASMNFSYAALYRGMPGINPVTAQGLLAGGLFGTTQGQYGDGTPLGDFYKENHIARPDLNGTTNFERMMPMLRKQYGNTPWLLDAMKNHFGLQSIQQAAVLAKMDPNSLHNMSGMVTAAGLNLSELKDTSYAGLAGIANAKTPKALRGIYSETMKRKDLTDAERSRLSGAAAGGDMDKLRNELVKVVGTHEQVETEGSKTRQSVTDLKDELTRVGGLLLAPLNMIRDSVVSLAEKLAPDQVKNPLRAENMHAPLVGAYRQEQLDRMKKLVETNSPLDAAFKAAGAKTGIDWRDLKLRGAMESGLDGKLTGPNTRSGRAFGVMQVMPKTGAAYGYSVSDLMNPAKNIMAGARIYADILKQTGGDKEKADRLYYAGTQKGIGPNSNQYAANNAAARAYVLGHDGDVPGGTPIPEGDPAGKGNASGAPQRFTFGDANVIIKDANGNERGRAVLKPHAAPSPAGAN